LKDISILLCNIWKNIVYNSQTLLLNVILISYEEKKCFKREILLLTIKYYKIFRDIDDSIECPPEKVLSLKGGFVLRALMS